MTNSKNITLQVFLTIVVFALPAFGQTSAVFSVGFTHPNKIINAGDDHLLVTEAGNAAEPNSGRISTVNSTTGERRTLITGLPSGNNTVAPTAPESVGPSALYLQGRALYVAISTGDAVQRHPNGIELENPDPSSPIFVSILELSLPGKFTQLSSPFVMTLDHQFDLANHGHTTVKNGEGQTLPIRMVVDLPNSVPNPRPDIPLNRRQSNPFGIEIFQKHLFVVDASLNLLYRISIGDGNYEHFAVFPPRPNPTPIGPPFIEAVPDSVHRVGKRLIVSMLTGFPFVSGFAEVRAISLKDGSHEVLISGLTTAIDTLHLGENGSDGSLRPGENSSFYTLEFSTNMLAGAPGRLRYYDTPTAAPADILSSLITPTSMARDEATGDLFITNIGPGTITRVSGLNTFRETHEN
jgi:hypothetical protein